MFWHLKNSSLRCLLTRLNNSTVFRLNEYSDTFDFWSDFYNFQFLTFILTLFPIYRSIERRIQRIPSLILPQISIFYHICFIISFSLCEREKLRVAPLSFWCVLVIHGALIFWLILHLSWSRSCSISLRNRSFF